MEVNQLLLRSGHRGERSAGVLHDGRSGHSTGLPPGQLPLSADPARDSSVRYNPETCGVRLSQSRTCQSPGCCHVFHRNARAARFLLQALRAQSNLHPPSAARLSPARHRSLRGRGDRCHRPQLRRPVHAPARGRRCLATAAGQRRDRLLAGRMPGQGRPDDAVPYAARGFDPLFRSKQQSAKGVSAIRHPPYPASST